MMTDMRRYLDIHGTVIEATLEHVNGSWVAYHDATQASGIGRTEEDAIEALRATLDHDRAWFCEGLGTRLLISAGHIERCMRMQGIFCPTGATG
jgi:hypothetical protein